MVYKIVVSQRAQKEIENAAEYYSIDSVDAPVNFLKALANTYQVLAKKPFYRVRYKNIRALKIKKFPYSLYFVVNQTNNTIRVLSCFHNKRNPNKRPRF